MIRKIINWFRYGTTHPYGGGLGPRFVTSRERMDYYLDQMEELRVFGEMSTEEKDRHLEGLVSDLELSLRYNIMTKAERRAEVNKLKDKLDPLGGRR